MELGIGWVHKHESKMKSRIESGLSSIERLATDIEILAIKSYQTVSRPVYSLLDHLNISPAKCRYTPSCSQYTIEAIKEWGPMRGMAMGFSRILRCNPLGGYGCDPVPRKGRD
jgi:putative membrane protein insertion efficiency factor